MSATNHESGCICSSASRLLSSALQGCLCSFSVSSFLPLLSQTLLQKTPSHCLQVSLSLFKTLILTSTSSTSSLCSQLFLFTQILGQIKIELFAHYLSLYPRVSLYTQILISETLFHILFSIPCSGPCVNNCRRALQRISNKGTLVKFLLPLLDSFSNNIKDPNHHHDENNRERERENSSSSSRTQNSSSFSSSFRCRTSLVTSLNSHARSSILYITSEYLEGSWKDLVSSKAFSRHSPEIQFSLLSFWYHMTSIISSNGILAGNHKFYILSQFYLFDSLFAPSESFVLWTTKLMILNGTLCYGSTYALTSDIPNEILNLSQKLLRHFVNSAFELPFLPSSFPGLGGNQVDLTADSLPPSNVRPQYMILIIVKALAIVVRSSVLCDGCSSEDSSESEGSSESEESLRLETSLFSILDILTSWMKSSLSFHPNASFSSMFLKIFEEQDDLLIEGLLCLLDIYVGFKWKNLDFLEPSETFNGFLQNFSLNSSLLLDFLLSNETCFLLYFLRLLKYLIRSKRKKPFLLSTDSSFSRTSSLFIVLKDLNSSINKLTVKSLFPYDISPVQNLLKIILRENNE